MTHRAWYWLVRDARGRWAPVEDAEHVPLQLIAADRVAAIRAADALRLPADGEPMLVRRFHTLTARRRRRGRAA